MLFSPLIKRSICSFRSFFFGNGGLISNIARIKGFFRKNTFKASDSSSLLDFLEAFDPGLKGVYNLSASDGVYLMQVADSALNQLYQNERLDNSIASTADL